MMASRRLHALQTHLEGGLPRQITATSPDKSLSVVGASGAPPREVVAAAVEKKFDDAQLKQFLSQGCE